jgi:hypothetical protein
MGNIMTFNSFHCEKKGGSGLRLKKVEEVIIKLDFPTNSKGSNSALHFRIIPCSRIIMASRGKHHSVVK